MQNLDLTYQCTMDAMHSAFDELSAWLKAQELPKGTVFKVRVIAEELMSNVVRHGENGDADALTKVNVAVEPDAVAFTIEAPGVPFNPVENKDLGVGLTITNGSASDILYSRQNDLNITTVIVNR